MRLSVLISFPKFLMQLAFAWLLLASILPAAAAGPLFASEPETAAAPTQADLLGRETPRSTVSGLIRALAEQDHDRAAQYFDLPANSSRQRAAAAARAREFQALLDSGGSLQPYAALSNDGPGKIGDDLPVDQERVGEIRAKGRTIPVLLSRG